MLFHHEHLLVRYWPKVSKIDLRSSCYYRWSGCSTDQNLLQILGERMKISDTIGKLKKKNNVAVLQNKRWNEILGKMVLDGENHGLSEEFVLKLFKAIHQESINHQEKVIVK